MVLLLRFGVKGLRIVRRDFFCLLSIHMPFELGGKVTCFI